MMSELVAGSAVMPISPSNWPRWSPVAPPPTDVAPRPPKPPTPPPNPVWPRPEVPPPPNRLFEPKRDDWPKRLEVLLPKPPPKPSDAVPEALRATPRYVLTAEQERAIAVAWKVRAPVP